MCYGLFATFRLTRACFVHVLHTIEVAHPVFLAPNRNFTGILIICRYIEVQIDRTVCCTTPFVLQFGCDPPRTSISTPSYRYMRTKLPCTEITSKNAKISNLDLYNIFLAGSCYTKLYESSYTWIYTIFSKFAPILRSQKKVIFACSGPNKSKRKQIRD